MPINLRKSMSMISIRKKKGRDIPPEEPKPLPPLPRVDANNANLDRTQTADACAVHAKSESSSFSRHVQTYPSVAGKSAGPRTISTGLPASAEVTGAETAALNSTETVTELDKDGKTDGEDHHYGGEQRKDAEERKGTSERPHAHVGEDDVQADASASTSNKGAGTTQQIDRLNLCAILTSAKLLRHIADNGANRKAIRSGTQFLKDQIKDAVDGLQELDE